MVDHQLLSVYLNNHFTGASGGVEMFGRVAKQHAGSSWGAELARLAADIDEDRERLRDIMGRLGVAENRAMTLLGWVGEKVGRVKPNGYLVRRSPLSDVVELEGLRIAVAAKQAGWEVLREVAAHDTRVSTDEVETLIGRAEDQSERLQDLHLRAAREELSEGP